MYSPSGDSCSQPASPTLLAAIRQFNAGAFFTCHETLEELWRIETIPLRTFYQGLLQVAVGLNHLRRGNERGTVALLNSGATAAPICAAVSGDQCGIVTGRGGAGAGGIGSARTGADASNGGPALLANHADQGVTAGSKRRPAVLLRAVAVR